MTFVEPFQTQTVHNNAWCPCQLEHLEKIRQFAIKRDSNHKIFNKTNCVLPSRRAYV